MMTPALEGGYIRLLAYDWDNDGIPNDDDQLANLSRLGEGWLKGGCQMVKPCFIPHPSKPGFLTSARLLKEREKQLIWREKSKEGGIKSASLRANKRSKGGSRVVEPPYQPNGNIAVCSLQSLTEREPVEIDLPVGFPKDEQHAVAHAAFVGCPDAFAAVTWNKAMGRGGLDAKGNQVKSFRHYLASEWKFDQNRAGEKKHHEQRNNQQNPRPRTDLNQGTANDGAAGEYSQVGKRKPVPDNR